MRFNILLSAEQPLTENLPVGDECPVVIGVTCEVARHTFQFAEVLLINIVARKFGKQELPLVILPDTVDLEQVVHDRNMVRLVIDIIDSTVHQVEIVSL